LTWLGRLVAAGSHDDWERLMAVYEPLLKIWLMRAGVHAADADDLVQEVLIVVVRRVAEFDRQHSGAFRGWLRAILANHLKKYFRQRPKIVAQLDLEQLCQSDSRLARDLDSEHDEFLARRALQTVQRDFSTATWNAFRRQVLDGESPEVVASELGLTLNAVIKAKSRVLKRVRDELRGLTD
jgi:RNA polymerase sigma-70 factor (ECF subfamily)